MKTKELNPAAKEWKQMMADSFKPQCPWVCKICRKCTCKCRCLKPDKMVGNYNLSLVDNPTVDYQIYLG